MDKKGEESVGVSFMWLVYLVLTVLILGSLVIYTKERVTGSEFSNLYTADTLASFYGLISAAPGDIEIKVTDSKPYSLSVEGDRISVVKDNSEKSAETYFIKNGFLRYKDAGIYVNTTVKLTKEGDDIFGSV